MMGQRLRSTPPLLALISASLLGFLASRVDTKKAIAPFTLKVRNKRYKRTLPFSRQIHLNKHSQEIDSP